MNKKSLILKFFSWKITQTDKGAGKVSRKTTARSLLEIFMVDNTKEQVRQFKYPGSLITDDCYPVVDKKKLLTGL